MIRKAPQVPGHGIDHVAQGNTEQVGNARRLIQIMVVVRGA